jgi:hypothetical protein
MTTGFCALIGLVAFSFASASESVLQVALTPWKAECKTPLEGSLLDCGLPAAYGSALHFSMKLPDAAEPGTARSESQDFVDLTVRGRMTLFAVHPAIEAETPPYVQIRLELSSPVRAICMQSVRRREPIELPPLLCSGLQQQNTETTQIGLNAVITSR